MPAFRQFSGYYNTGGAGGYAFVTRFHICARNVGSHDFSQSRPEKSPWWHSSLAREADFFSLGTNDLTQYTLAVDRGNARVARLFQPLHPAVLRLVGTAIDSAHGAGKWIGMCGELAGMRKAIPILVGLGLDEFSMAPGRIPEAKALIGRLDSGQARRLADETLALATADEIDARMDRFLGEMGWTTPG